MRGKRGLGSRAIRLDRSAYKLLSAQRRPSESFSEEIRRILGAHGPELREFLTLLSFRDAARVADSIEASRAEDLKVARVRYSHRQVELGHRV